MMDIQVYIILTTIMLGFLAIIWSSKYWKDIFIKIVLIGLTITGIAIYLKHFYL
jgi:hypothetical protein